MGSGLKIVRGERERERERKRESNKNRYSELDW